jgi:regulator of nonsense transcripts 1
MHPAISAFPSEVFYNKLLSDGVFFERKWEREVLPWPNLGLPLMFWNVRSVEENYESALSYVNRNEALCVSLILERMAENGVKGCDVGIITPYAGQQTYLIECLPFLCGNLERGFFEDLEIASVDAFQGREKNFVIFSLVRANDSNQIGFVKDVRRMCVSLTRAKYGLVVVGNAETFARNKLWVKYIEHCISVGVFVEGDGLDGLRKGSFNSMISETEVGDVDEVDFMDLGSEDDVIF